MDLAILLLLFTIDQKHYNQRQGLFIGAPTSPCFAEMDYFLKITVAFNSISIVHNNIGKPILQNIYTLLLILVTIYFVKPQPQVVLYLLLLFH